MNIQVKRHWFTDKSTCGVITIDGETQGFTLEDVARPNGVKVQDKTCIPPGEYPIIVDHSTRFNCLMPHVQNVPSFTGIRIHPGNTDLNTSGCILVGLEKGFDVIWSSRTAFDRIFDKIKTAFDKQEPICLTITNEPL